MSRTAHAAVRRGGDPDAVPALELSLLCTSLLLVAAMVSILLGGLLEPARDD